MHMCVYRRMFVRVSMCMCAYVVGWADSLHMSAVWQARKAGPGGSRFIAEFQKDMEALGCLSPAAEPQATQYVPQMVRTIQSIVGKGHAYESEGDVLFAVDSIEGYGRLSGRSLVRPFPPPSAVPVLFFLKFLSLQSLSQRVINPHLFCMALCLPCALNPHLFCMARCAEGAELQCG